MRNKSTTPKIKHYFAFSFVELIVWITISMMLMLSVSIFVQNGIKNLTTQKSTLDNDVKIKDFIKSIYETTNSYDNSFQNQNLTSGALFKINKTFDKWWWTYLWVNSLNEFYCESWSENPITNHIILKSFIPFEWQGGDIFSWYNFESWSINTSLFSWTINNNQIQSIIWPTDIAINWGTWYVSDTLWHSIYEFDISTISWFKKIAWSEVFWDEFFDWNNWTWFFLNSPTWLSFSNPYLFISDTLNDRILYLNTTNNKIYKLLGREEWLKEPTWIYYNDSEKTLYIANSWKKEILSYSSSWSFVNSSTLNFTPTNDINNVNKLEFSFFYASWTTNPALTSPTGTWNIIFNPNIQNIDFLTWTTNKLTYYLSNYSNLINNDYPCTSNWFFLSWSIDTPYKIDWCNWSTWSLYSWNLYKTFTWWTNYQITINNISWTNFNNTWAYYIKLNLLSWSTIQKSYYFPYFSKWDNNIFTKDDNILKTITWSLWYPTWIYPNWNNLAFNDFIKRERIEITKTWTLVWTPLSLNSVNFENIPRNKYTDISLYTPIKNYEISTDNNLLSIFINYYKNYSCYWDESINQTKEFILKKNLR